MKKNINKGVLVLLFSLSLYNCVSYKMQLLKGKGDVEQARMNVITDFVNTYKTPRYYLKKREGKPFDVFIFVREKQLNDGIYIFSILPEFEAITLRIEDSLGKAPRTYLPNRYVIKNDKLFLWNDSITPLEKDVLNIMKKYGALDSTDIKRELGLLSNSFEDTRLVTFDDRLESVNYFICKNNIEKYKKVVTNKPFEYYKAPYLDCGIN